MREWRREQISITFFMLICMNEQRAAVSEWSNKAVLRLRIAATSIPVYVTRWSGHVFESYSQPFMLTYPEADLSNFQYLFM